MKSIIEAIEFICENIPTEDGDNVKKLSESIILLAIANWLLPDDENECRDDYRDQEARSENEL